MPISHHFLAVLIAFCWGANYVASKVGMEYFPPIFYTALRFMLTGLLLLPFLPKVGHVLGGRAVQIKVAQIALVLCVGHMAFILMALDMGLSIASTSIIIELGVPISCVLGVLLLGDTIGRWRVLGIIICLIGVAMIHGSPNISDHPFAFFVALGATVAWAISNIQMKQLPAMHALRLFACLSIYAVPMLLLTSYLIEGDQWRPVLSAPLSAWLSLAYTVIGSTVIGYGGWAYLIREHQVSLVAPYSLSVPVFGMLAGWVWYGEVPSEPMLAGGAVIIVGVAVIIIRWPKMLSKGGVSI